MSPLDPLGGIQFSSIPSSNTLVIVRCLGGDRTIIESDNTDNKTRYYCMQTNYIVCITVFINSLCSIVVTSLTAGD